MGENRTTVDFNHKTWQGWGEKEVAHFSNAERKDLSTLGFYIQQRYPSKTTGEIKKCSDEGQL